MASLWLILETPIDIIYETTTLKLCESSGLLDMLYYSVFVFKDWIVLSPEISE